MRSTGISVGKKIRSAAITMAMAATTLSGLSTATAAAADEKWPSSSNFLRHNNHNHHHYKEVATKGTEDEKIVGDYYMSSPSATFPSDSSFLENYDDDDSNSRYLRSSTSTMIPFNETADISYRTILDDENMFIEDNSNNLVDNSRFGLGSGYQNSAANTNHYYNDTYDYYANCTGNDCYTQEELLESIHEYIYPTTVEWFLIVAHLIVFIVGIVGNALVCVAVYRNNSMRTVTNYFIVNLAVADFMVILFCLPPTVIWDVTETWFFGDALCKIILYLQTVSVAVSVLTLTGISVERWYAICYPLKFKATTSRAKRVILIIWVIALTIDTPELIFLHTVPGAESKGINMTTIYFTQCEPSWTHKYEVLLIVARVLTLYLIPLAFMSLAYYKIVRVLFWSSANFLGRSDTAPMNNINSHTNSSYYHPQQQHNYQHNNHNGNNNAHYNSPVVRPMLRGQTSQGNAAVDYQLKSRRKAAKMLVAVVSVFAFCYLPVHMFNLTVITATFSQSELMSAIAMICHWLPYANSAINPVIYNFMSGKFRREFARAFECLYCKHAYIPTATASRVYTFKHNTHQSHDIHRV